MKTVIIAIAVFLSLSTSAHAQKNSVQKFNLSYLMSEQELYNLADSSGLIKISDIVNEVRNEGYFLIKPARLEELKTKLKNYKKIITPRLLIADQTLQVYTYKDSYGDRHVSISVPEYLTIADAKKITIVAAD
jgi:hypothetical protein